MNAYKLTQEQREAILGRQWNRMLQLGGNIYFTAKLGATDGHSFQQLAAKMTGSSQQDYASMMLSGGRSVEGNRSRSGKNAPSKFLRAGGGRSGKSAPAKRQAKAKVKSKSKAKPKTRSAKRK